MLIISDIGNNDDDAVSLENMYTSVYIWVSYIFQYSKALMEWHDKLHIINIIIVSILILFQKCPSVAGRNAKKRGWQASVIVKFHSPYKVTSVLILM